MNLSELNVRLLKLGLVTKLYINQSLKSVGLHNGQMQILNFIKQHPNCTQIEISQALNVSPASIALTTKKMDKNHLIKKTIEEDNLRCKHLDLTEKGEGLISECITLFNERDEKMYKGFSEEELKVFASFIDRITTNLTNEDVNIISEETVTELLKDVESIE